MRKPFGFVVKPLALLLMTLPFAAHAQEAKLSEVVVTAPPESQDDAIVFKRVTTSDTASLLLDTPGVSLYSGGGISSLPVIHGMADDRIKILVDGMQSTSACANHMNPPLSYIDPNNVAKIGVMAGLTPVSFGGDSIGGSISIESAPPVFAHQGEDVRKAGTLSIFNRSVNGSSGAAFSGSIANSNTSLGLSGSIDRAGDYKDGHGDKVTSTYYEARNVGINFAAQGDGNLVTVKVGNQTIPRQGFVNQPMDMVGNEASFINVGYMGDFAWGKLDAKAYWQDTRHKMNIGSDKLTIPAIANGMNDMPMNTHGKDIGYSLKAEIPLANQNTLRLGNEFHRFTLDDWWPPVPGDLSGWMGPGTFQSINNGRRDRFSLFAEWESKWNPQWTTLLGLRNDTVRMDTGNVQAYSTPVPALDPVGLGGPGYIPDANAFNAQGHARRDNNWDLTALARYEPSSTSTYEAGFARKTRSPNLYERYSWSTNMMASAMIGWFGDNNMYVGNLNLRPEVANTLSATADWHDSARRNWEFKATPYYTYVHDYIGVDVLMPGTLSSQLQFANHNAKIYGLDLSGKVGLWDNDSYGDGQLKGSLGYVRGKALDTGNSLYHMMPLNVRASVEQHVAAWTNAVELQLVDDKSQVDPLRNEMKTPGYTLVNVRTSYQWEKVRLDVGITNLFNKFYYLPLGGVNYDNYAASNWTQIGPLAGQGRSVNVGATLKF